MDSTSPHGAAKGREGVLVGLHLPPIGAAMVGGSSTRTPPPPLGRFGLLYKGGGRTTREPKPAAPPHRQPHHLLLHLLDGAPLPRCSVYFIYSAGALPDRCPDLTLFSSVIAESPGSSSTSSRLRNRCLITLRRRVADHVRVDTVEVLRLWHLIVG